MAANERKQGGGRTTAKGTQPPPRKRGPQTGPAGMGGGGRALGPQSVGGGGAGGGIPTVNRQMRRAGIEVPDQSEAEAQQKKRLRLVLIGGGALLAVMTVVAIVSFGVSGTWIGLLGAAAGLGVGFAVTTGKTFLAKQGLPAAIAIGVVGVVAAALGGAKVVNMHWPFFAVFGCGVGAFLAWVSAQQMTSPPDPPAGALALLRRNGAQMLEAPGAGSCVWAMPDGRIRVVVGAEAADGVTADDVLRDKSVLKARQQATILVRRMAAAGIDSGYLLVLDQGIQTVRDGDATICSVSQLNKVLGRASR